MINWVIEQQEALTLALLVVWLSDSLLVKRLGARFTYRLYALIPLALAIANIPPISVHTALPISGSVSGGIATAAHVMSDYRAINHVALDSANKIQWIWLIGVVVLLVSTSIGLARLTLLPKSPVLDEKRYEQLPSGIFYTSQKVKGPILKGIFKPEIILPANYKHYYDSEQLEYVIEHELVHAKRHDNLWNLIALTFLVFFWFNPVTWLVYLRFRLTQECACDEEVLLQADKSKKILYSRTMLKSYEHWNNFWIFQSHYGDKMTMITRINRLKSSLKPSKLAQFFAGGLSAAVLSLLFAWSQVSASAPFKINMNEATLSTLTIPRAAFIEGIQGEVHLQFDVENGKVSSVNVIEVVTSGAHEKQFEASATEFIKSLPFQGDNANLAAAEYVARFHLAGVGASQAALDQVTKKMPHRIIHVLPYSIVSPANEIVLNGVPKLQFIKRHYPDYPVNLEDLGISASAIVELDVRASGVAVNTRVISVDAPAEYRDDFQQAAQNQASDLYVFKNSTGEQINNVRVALQWSPADLTKGFDASKVRKGK